MTSQLAEQFAKGPEISRKKSIEIPSPTLINQIAASFGLEEARLKRGTSYDMGSSTFRLATSRGELVLQRYRARTFPNGDKAEASKLRLDQQHALLSYLSERGFPVAEPLRTRAGHTTVDISGITYALYPFMTGRPMDPGNPRHMKEAANALALYHRLTAKYSGLTYGNQYSFPKLFQERLHGFYEDIEDIDGLTPASHVHQVLQPFQDSLPEIEGEVARLPYDSLSKVVIHGDFRRENLLFSRGKMSALIDFGRSRYEARALDLAIAITELGPRTYDKTFLDLARSFMFTYNRQMPLDDAERRALPILTQAWTAWRAFRKIRKLVHRKEQQKRVRKANQFSWCASRLKWLRENSLAWNGIFSEGMDL